MTFKFISSQQAGRAKFLYDVRPKAIHVGDLEILTGNIAGIVILYQEPALKKTMEILDSMDAQERLPRVNIEEVGEERAHVYVSFQTNVNPGFVVDLLPTEDLGDFDLQQVRREQIIEVRMRVQTSISRKAWADFTNGFKRDGRFEVIVGRPEGIRPITLWQATVTSYDKRRPRPD